MKTSVSILVLALLSSVTLVSQSQEARLRDKYYEKWLDQDVIYIISDEERAVFSKLQTPEEKDNFIEEFWRRRSPNPARDQNEYKEEHYRRIAHANTKFGSGIPGWKTDRGRIYIMFGEPAEIEDHAGGENYYRKPYEGAGRTTVYPFQVWRYRHIDGIGDDIEIEFVDQSWTGLYKMSMNAWDKDMLLQIDGEGLTLGERTGLLKRSLRPGLHPGYLNDMRMMKRYGMRLQDTPFQRMLRYFELQRPPVIRNKELQTIVETRVSYNTLPFHYGINYVWIDDEKALVPITMEIENRTLSYQQALGTYRARVGLYGVVTALNGKIVAEFEDNIASEYKEALFAQGQLQKSMYQKPVILPTGLFRVDLVVKDLNTGNVGTFTTRVNISKLSHEGLTTSPLVLAKVIQPMDAFPDAPQTFVIGDLKIVPNITRTYRPDDHLNLYFQVYNSGRDSSESKPKLVTTYSIFHGDKTIAEIKDQDGSSAIYSTEHRVIMARRLGLRNLAPGNYRIAVDVHDAITGQTASVGSPFEVIAP